MNKLLYLKLVVHREARDFDMRDQGDTYVAIGDEVSQCTATVPGSIGDPSMYALDQDILLCDSIVPEKKKCRTLTDVDQEIWLGDSTVPERLKTKTNV
jgi:hypothetical protein